MSIAEQLRQQLADELCKITAGWSTYEAMAAMRLRPERISELRHGNLARFSIARLVRLIAMHGYDVELALRPKARPAVARQQPSATVLRYDRFGRPANGP
jgi:predicted XRE-type DNA-binding protein